MPCLFVAVWVCGLLIGVSDQQKIDRFQIVRQLKFFSDDIGLEVADPHTAQTKFGSLQHHVIGQDGSVDVARLFLVKRTHPCLSMVCTHQDCERSAIDVGGFFQLFQTFFLFGNNQVDRLQICCGWQLAGFYQAFLFLPFCYCSGAQSISFLQSQ